MRRDPKAKNLLGPKNSLPHDYTVPQAYRTAIPEELYATAFLGERACAYLDEAKDDEPFFLMVSFPDPHHPFNPPGKYWDMYKPEQFPVPEAFSRNDWTPPRAGAEHLQGARERQGQPDRHGHHRRVGARGAGGEGADLRHDRLHRRRHRRGASGARQERQARRHGGDLHQRPRRSSRRSPADAQGRRAVSEHRAGAVHLVGPAGERAAEAHRCAGLDHGHRLDRARARQDRAGERRAGEEPAAGAGRQPGAGFRVHPVRPPGVEPGHRRAGAGPHADRRPLPAERVPRHRLGRAVRSAGRSGRVRKSLGQSGACARPAPG